MGRLNQVWKRRLLAGVTACAFACVLTTASQAQILNQPQLLAQPQSQAPARAGPVVQPGPADTVLGDKGFYLEADTIVRDDENHNWTAKGSVEARYNGKVLRTDQLDYNQSNGVVTARGNVQLLSPDGTSEFAKTMTLDKDFHAGVALAFSTRQQPNTKIVADEAIRLSQDALELNKAVFTVCDLCAPDGTPKQPTWSIQAAQVVEDKKLKIVYYHNAVIRVKGLPVAATPIFWHVDPTAGRGSGLLAPEFAFDGRRGFSYQQPYLFALSPSQDLVVAPQFNTKVAPLLTGEYRQRFYTGQIDVRAGYTYAQQFDNTGKGYDNDTSRSYILASGAFAPTPNLSWGFTAERVTDPLMFSRYAVPNAFDARGLLPTDDQRLVSEIYGVEQNSRSYVSVSALSIQGLRPGDLNGTFPTIAPLVEAHFEPDYKLLGGRLRVDASGVMLDRARNVYTDTGPGDDSKRATLSSDWRSSYTFYDGIRLEPFLQARGDFYNTVNPSQTFTGAAPTAIPGQVTVNGNTVTYNGDHTVGRALGTAGVDLSWPFFRRTGDLTVVLEPLAQLAVSPRATINKYIPNEDSQVVDFDETNLFTANKSPGFDYYEGGARANAGGRVTFRWDSGAQAQALIGRSFRTTADPTLPANSGLNLTQSDWVVAASGQLSSGFSAFTRALLDSQTTKIERLEVGANVSGARGGIGVSYLRDEVDATTGTRTENAGIGGSVLVTKHWGFVSSAQLDLVNHYAVTETFGLQYQDECIHWELDYVHDGTINRTLHGNDRIMLRLLLVTLGSTGYQRPDFR
jgi:LPS-assembly protein